MSNEDTRGLLNIKLPVKIKYETLQQTMQKKMVGEIIRKDNEEGVESSGYAQILDVDLYSSELQEYHLAVEVHFQTLTSVFRNKQGTAIAHLQLALDVEDQEIYVREFKVKVNTESWLVDKLLQTILNKWMYRKLKNKMHFRLGSKIETALLDLNAKMGKGFEVKEGVSLLGGMEGVKIVHIEATETHLEISVQIDGKIEVEIIQLPDV